jgi:hypothetical protein
MATAILGHLRIFNQLFSQHGLGGITESPVSICARFVKAQYFVVSDLGVIVFIYNNALMRP